MAIRGDIFVPKPNINQSNFYRLANLLELKFLNTCGYEDRYGEFLILNGFSRNVKYDSIVEEGTIIVLALDAVQLKYKVNSESNYSIF